MHSYQVMIVSPSFRRALLGALLPLTALTGFSAESEDFAALRAQVQQLEQQLKIVARKLELQEESSSASAASAPKVTMSDKGLTIASADNANWFKLHGLVQFDSRLFFNDGGLSNNSFVLRRARLINEGQFAKRFGYQLTTEFGGSAVSSVDANFTVAVNPALQF